jgi:hypothetical protein
MYKSSTYTALRLSQKNLATPEFNALLGLPRRSGAISLDKPYE